MKVPLLLIFPFALVLLSACFGHVHVVVFLFRVDLELVAVHHSVLAINLLAIVASVAVRVVFVSCRLSVIVDVELECFVVYDVADDLEQLLGVVAGDQISDKIVVGLLFPIVDNCVKYVLDLSMVHLLNHLICLGILA